MVLGGNDGVTRAEIEQNVVIPTRPITTCSSSPCRTLPPFSSVRSSAVLPSAVLRPARVSKAARDMEGRVKSDPSSRLQRLPFDCRKRRCNAWLRAPVETTIASTSPCRSVHPILAISPGLKPGANRGKHHWDVRL